MTFTLSLVRHPDPFTGPSPFPSVPFPLPVPSHGARWKKRSKGEVPNSRPVFLGRAGGGGLCAGLAVVGGAVGRHVGSVWLLGVLLPCLLGCEPKSVLVLAPDSTANLARMGLCM